jgi:DNA oxidative demethylase
VTVMLDLFNRPVLPGLATTSDFVTATEEQALIAAIDTVGLSPFRFQGWTDKRLTASFGWTYDFDAGCLRRGDPIPDWLLPPRDRAADFTGLPPDDLVQALLIRYDAGAGDSRHPILEIGRRVHSEASSIALATADTSLSSTGRRPSP